MIRALVVALDYIGRGIPVAPVYGPDPTRPTGCSCSNAECETPAKHPTTRHGIHGATLDPRQARAWWGPGSTRGVAIATGTPSGMWVFDIDKLAGIRAIRDLQEQYGRLPETPTVRTPGGGFHAYFTMPTDRDVRISAGRIAPGLDVRGTGGYAIAPPSYHVQGRYGWVPGRSLDDLPLAAAPIWLLNLAAPLPKDPPRLPVPMEAPRGSRYLVAAIEAECQELATAPAGTRNERLYSAAYSLGRFVARGEADPGGIARALAYAAATTGLREREIATTIRSALRKRGVA